ncbi:PepSY domain-containing protein [Vibrio mangrovi]|uniref:PepSY domain-containing protein n=1 Tax=Vibrio mangrovi TaxID=474394 RepID=A0A1Y6ISD2_9VIBR|nr:PepSY domain-containing protein [Vibrio mangrovi]MDW6001411.1 PepSY domain-containing protein [Vibrio mangrovi]SMS00567.1 hypothetical protein VIM7927_01833 [Vibrio mangrovi]
MSKATFIRLAVLLSTTTASSLVFADPVCTQQPESSWMPFETARAKVVEMGYQIKKFKKTHTGCYELYGYDSNKNRVEIYYNPVDMSVVKEEKDD